MRNPTDLLSRSREGVLVYAAVAPADPCFLVLPRWAFEVVKGKRVVVAADEPWGVYAASPNDDGSVGIALRGTFASAEAATDAAVKGWDAEERPAPIA